MKVYVLLRHVDYEGSAVMGVYRAREPADAEARRLHLHDWTIPGDARYEVKEFELRE